MMYLPSIFGDNLMDDFFDDFDRSFFKPARPAVRTDRMNLMNETTVITTTKSGKARSATVKSSAYDIVNAAIDSKIGRFTKRDIVNICPGISEKSVELAIKKLKDEGYIEKHGSGRSTFYARVFS